METMTLKMIVAVLVFILLDFASGWMQAIKNGIFQSSVMREGIWHKAGELMLIVLGIACEYFLPWLGVEITVPIVKGICVYLCIMELASIVENIGAAFPELQKALSKFFGAYTDKDE